MSQYGHQRESINQNQQFLNNQQFNYNQNQVFIEDQIHYEKDLDSSNYNEYQVQEDGEMICINDHHDNNQFILQGYEDSSDDEDDDLQINHNMLNELSEDQENQQEYLNIQQQVNNNVPDENQKIIFADQAQKFMNQKQKQNSMQPSDIEYQQKAIYQNFVSSAQSQQIPIRSGREQEMNIYQEQENMNQMKSSDKFNLYEKQKQQQSNMMYQTQYQNINNNNNYVFTGNNGINDGSNHNIGMVGNKQQVQVGVINLCEKQLNSNSNMSEPKLQSNSTLNFNKYPIAKIDDNGQRNQFQNQQFSNNGMVISSGNISQFKQIEESDIKSGQLSQRNHYTQNSVSGSQSQLSKNQLSKNQLGINSNQQLQKQQQQQQILIHNHPSSHAFMYEDKAFCNYCQNSERYFYDSSQIVSRLYLKYASSQNYYYTRDLNEILNNFRSKAAIHYKDIAMLDEEAEYLKRYYTQQEYPKKSKLLTEYYKFHKDIPRLFMLPETWILNNFHDKKRRYDYFRIAQLIEEENKRNPSRPPKGIVGEKPPLRTNETSDEAKQENEKIAEQNKVIEKSSDKLLGDISSFINRGEEFQLDNGMKEIEDQYNNNNNQEINYTDRFILGNQFQHQQQQQQQNQQQQLKQNQQQQIPSHQLQQQLKQGSQVQQYEISASAFLNYQRKLELFKNSNNNQSGQNKGGKQNQQIVQQMNQKQNKKTLRTDASLTIQELNMKLEEIVTSHSLISGTSRFDNAGDDDLVQLDFRELDQFLKFLHKKENNFNPIKSSSNLQQQFSQSQNNNNNINNKQLKAQNQLQNSQMNQQNQQILQQNQQPIFYQTQQNQQPNQQNHEIADNLKQSLKDAIAYANLKDIYMTKNTGNLLVEKSIKKLTPQISSQRGSQQQKTQTKANSVSNPLLLQLQQQQQQGNIFQNDTSRNNLAMSSNNSNTNYQHIFFQQQQQPNYSTVQQQQQQLQSQQQLSGVSKNMKSKPSQGEIINSQQYWPNTGSNNDIQQLQSNDAKNMMNMNQLSGSPQPQLTQQQTQQNQNFTMKNSPNPAQQQNQIQSKKRLTPQLRLDDLEYYNENKNLGSKQLSQQQMIGSLSVKISHRDQLNAQNTYNSVRSARDQYPTITTSNSKSNMKNSCDSKLSGAFFSQANNPNNTAKQQSQQQSQQLQIQQLQQQQQLIPDGYLNSNIPKNLNTPHAITSNSFAFKLDTKESQLFTPRQPQIQSTIAAQSSNNKNLFSKCNQIIQTKPPLSPRDSVLNTKKQVNPGSKIDNNISSTNNNLNINNNNNNQIQEMQSGIQFYPQNQTDQQNPLRQSFSSKNDTLKKKQLSQQISSQYLSQQGTHNNSNNTQTGNNSQNNNNTSNTNNNNFYAQNQISNNNLQNDKKGSQKQLTLKLKLDQLNFSKEKSNINCSNNYNNNDNNSCNQIIKDPLSQRSCSSKNLDNQTPKYNLYEMFKQQITNSAYTSVGMTKPDNQSSLKSHTAKNSVTSSSAYNMLNIINTQLLNSQKTDSQPQNQNNNKFTNPQLKFLNQNDIQNFQGKQQQQQNVQIQEQIQQQQQPQFQQDQQQQQIQQQMISSPSQQTKQKPLNSTLNNNGKLTINTYNEKITQDQLSPNNNQAQLNGMSSIVQQNLLKGTRTTTNSTNRKSAAFIHINNSGNNIQITSPKNQLEQQKKIINNNNKQTARSEANTRKNSQIKNIFEKSQHSTAGIGMNSGGGIQNSKHVSRNSSIEINTNSNNVLRKKSPQLFKQQQQQQQKETKNIYNLVQQLQNNFTQNTPKQTVSARNYQTQRSSINYFDFQKPEIVSFGSQNILSPTANFNSQSPSYSNHSIQQRFNQQGNETEQYQNDQYALNQQDVYSQAQIMGNPEFITEQGISSSNKIISIEGNIQNNNNNNIKQNNNSYLNNNQMNFNNNPSQNNNNFKNNNNYLQQNTMNSQYSQSNTNLQNQLSQQVQQQLSQNSNKVSSPQIMKKVSNLHKHTKSENLNNLLIETNIQSCFIQPNQNIQSPQNQTSLHSGTTTHLGQNSTIKKIHKIQQYTNSVMNNPITTNPNSQSLKQNQQSSQQLQQQQPFASQQMSPRIFLNQNFQAPINDKQIYNQSINQQGISSGQFLHKKQSLASPLSSRSTQINFQQELFRSTSNSTNNNNSNTNNTNSQHNNNPNFNNNSSSINSQLNNNNNNNNQINNNMITNNNNNNNNSNSHNSTAQINCSLNNMNNNFVTSSTNANTLNQLNYVGLSVSSNSSNPVSSAQQLNVQKKNSSLVQSSMNGLFGGQSQQQQQQQQQLLQQQIVKNSNSIATTNASNTNLPHNLLKSDHSLNSKINTKIKKKSMF